jgi:flagellar biosynthesis/type III secretory pathway protein FliH
MYLPYYKKIFKNKNLLYEELSMKKKKHKLPSRIKYEKNHPNVSFRIEKNLLLKLNTYLKKQKISKPDFIRIALKEKEENYDIAYNNGYKIGYEEGNKKGEEQGYDKGFKDWAIWIKCWRCLQPVYIKPNSKDHQQILNFAQGSIFHDECK